ncbi:dihydrofolate reductase [Blattabacterium sp. (Cryptocercus kyebangensis)]|uniref:dihydrofolate reductase n=1 Tax=Blattabacterium sp. (Cryptocercus kyebangensis) TaxID=298656 RepID=UPI000D7CEC09|nr:dihydrofolate reductase [Blattabacterium sp. (Cryptocercus kyebangensis)]AWU43839.1 dihydrofolate reductase [Blattabacterium sp. (Cryptocercus kyebangensis)]
MKIVLISAISKNGFIGKNNKLMWHLPNDLKRFKNMTLGETVLMGRKTFESIGRILPGRKNIILTKKNKINFSSSYNGIFKIFSSLKEVYDLNYEKIFVIGGEKVYTSTINKAKILELTIIHQKFYGDAKFPKINLKKWEKKYEFFYEKDKNHLYNYSFVRYEKKD